MVKTEPFGVEELSGRMARGELGETRERKGMVFEKGGKLESGAQEDSKALV